MKSYIKYKELSESIKEEIGRFHEMRRAEKPDCTLEEAMERWFDERFDAWIGSKAGNESPSGKRRHFRVEIEVPVRIYETLIENHSVDDGSLELIGTIVNISRGGIYFRSGTPIDVSSIIKVEVDFSEIDGEIGPIEALAMVVRVDPLEKGQFGIGVMFSSIYDEYRNNLDVFIFKNLAYYIYTAS